MTSQDKLKQLQTRLVGATALRFQDADNANPDVGMGYPWSYFVECALKYEKLTENDVYIEKLI